MEFVRNRSMNEDYKTVHDSDSSFEENDSDSQIEAEKEKVNSLKQINRQISQMSKGETNEKRNEDVINEVITNILQSRRIILFRRKKQVQIQTIKVQIIIGKLKKQLISAHNQSYFSTNKKILKETYIYLAQDENDKNNE